MFTLPKQLIKPNQKSPHKFHHLNQTETRKKPSINQIKEEIEFILNRNNSPFSLNVDKQIQRSQKNLHHHLLQRKRSKILQRANEENVQKAKNNRKMYQEYLMADFSARCYAKTLEIPKQTLQTLTLRQTSYSKQLPKDFSRSRTNFNSSRTLEPTRKQRKNQSMLDENKMQHLGLGKLLFYKDSNMKLKRTSLLNGHSFTEKKNLLDTAMESFYHEPSLDITRYLKHFDRQAEQEDQTNLKQPERALLRERSLEIFRKDIIPKQSPPPQLISSQNSEQFGASQSLKNLIEQNPQKQSKISKQLELSPHLRQMNQTLNVMDEQLLVYYGKLKNKKPSNYYLPSVTQRKTIFNRSDSKNKESGSFTQLFDIGKRNSIQKKNQLSQEPSWKFQHFDPWQKHKPEDDLDHQNVFGNENEQTGLTSLEKAPSNFISLGQSQKI